MSKVGLIARMDKTGLGQGQTLRLARLLKPSKLLIIDSTSFNGNAQYPEWYKGYESETIRGFPSEIQIRKFLTGLDTVLTCETFYNNHFTEIARDMRVKTICIANPEFFDWFKAQFAFIPEPNLVIVPSQWMIEEMESRFGAVYLPTPIFDNEFKQTRLSNLENSGRKFLFMNGKTAAMDRNGLESLYEALHLSKSKFTVTVKAQHDVKKHPDPRLIYDYSNPDDQAELYKGYDCLIQPRRYGGQTLSMCEALLCGLPVIMTDIDPNNKKLPKEWLLPATKTDTLMTRVELDVYSADPQALADMLDNIDLSRRAKEKAYKLGREYDPKRLKKKYKELIS